MHWCCLEIEARKRLVLCGSIFNCHPWRGAMHNGKYSQLCVNFYIQSHDSRSSCSVLRAPPHPPPVFCVRVSVRLPACLPVCCPFTFCVNRLINLDQSINPSINQSINESMVLKDSLHVQIYFEFLRSSPSIYLPIYLSIYLAS